MWPLAIRRESSFSLNKHPVKIVFRFVRMGSEEIAIRIFRVGSLKIEKQLAEKTLKVEASNTEYGVPLDAGKYTNVFRHMIG